MNRLEYLVASVGLRVLGWLFGLLPARPRRVVLASPRKSILDGNLLHIHRAIRELRPEWECVLLLEPYGYGLAAKAGYAMRMVRALYHLRTAAVVIVDNAYLPIHVAPHTGRTTVLQVWHATGALKRFGLDTIPPPREPERTFLHRHYDWVVTSGEASRVPWSRALRTPLGRVVALGSPRTDMFFDADALGEARARMVARYPGLDGHRVITYAPTFRGRGSAKRPGSDFDAQRARSAIGPADVLVLKSHPNLDARLVDATGFDVVVDPADDMNDLLAATDVLITDYSSSIFEYALLRRPLILLIPDLEAYERQPGLYLDYRTEMIGVQVTNTEAIIAALQGAAVDRDAWDRFIARHLGASDGASSARLVEQFLKPADG